MVDYQKGWSVGNCYTIEEKKKSNRFEDRPYFETELIKCKKKGNRVLNENLDKIKFPFGCTFEKPIFDDLNNPRLVTRIGEVFWSTNDYSTNNVSYDLYDITKQTNINNFIDSFNDLKSLIKKYNINIVKGKLLLFQK
jgi:hypothetical protein